MDRSGLVEWSEFCFSIMGDKAIKFGALADMEKLSTYLDGTLADYLSLKGSLGEANVNMAQRAQDNALMREKLEGMKNEVSNQMNSMLENMLGLDPADVMSEADIRKHLTEACNLLC